ncbi:Odorant receptor 383 [Nylanderia fulva]|uniref:Odorant receptor 383 n=1 Tax=Nylanderia fulva TaxID=613905 RepID=A0A6G1LQ21_9HYME|nr:Odorant receptor 383 [Nylanderia fulva]
MNINILGYNNFLVINDYGSNIICFIFLIYNFYSMILALIYVCVNMVLCIQYMPSFLNIVMPRNESRRIELLFQVKYFVDQEKYYHMIQFHLCIGLMLAVIIILSTESFCLLFVIHAFGMFKIARYTHDIYFFNSRENIYGLPILLTVTIRLLLMMEFPEEKCYRLNYILLASVGLWPYRNSNINQIHFVLLLLLYITCITIQVSLIKLFVTKYTLDIFLEIISFVTFYMAWIIKIFQLRVRDNWTILTNDQEINIMRKHAHIGKLFTIIIATIVYSGIFIYLLIHYIPSLLDIVIPLNESRSRKFVIQTEYSVDQQKYFHILAMHIYITLILIATTGVATETFSLTSAIHSFGMFKIASYRIEHMLSENAPQICIAEKYTIFHRKIIAAVDVHRRALEFAELLKATFGRSYLLVITIIICSGSLNLFYLYRLVTTQQGILEIIKCFLFIICHFLFLILGNFAGQEFINCDSHVHRTICNTKWYNAPIKAQKLILFYYKNYKRLQTRCRWYTLSLLFSFLTVLCSIQ